jgi:hypothetical protein
MPLRCVDPTGKRVHSFNLSDDAWQALMVENREARHLKMPCCNSPVVLKQSHLGKRPRELVCPDASASGSARFTLRVPVPSSLHACIAYNRKRIFQEPLRRA